MISQFLVDFPSEKPTKFSMAGTFESLEPWGDLPTGQASMGRRGFTQAMVKTWDLTLVKSWEKIGKNQPQNRAQRELDGFHMIWTIEDDETLCALAMKHWDFIHWIDNRDSLVMFCSKNGEWFPIYGHNRTWAFLRHSHGVEGPT